MRLVTASLFRSGSGAFARGSQALHARVPVGPGDLCHAAFNTATLALRAIGLHVTRDEKHVQMVFGFDGFTLVPYFISNWYWG